ncbi:unnamed protein product [Hermetia illucens]|uniref:Zinc metalloproteinase n=1 Tax=Hermetia illucens TaxID=343691 RepID=A0A7R8V224_HERIL|nr:uncharacterized protein LOC119656672 [Hermetia illucens]CAD7090204.1 unnamed protein product [Hermetia illucens]
MTGCGLHHEVFTANLKNDEIIGHQVVVIRGTVTGGICDAGRGEVLDTETGIRRDFQLTKGNVFKVLWSLRAGTNRIRINYCTATVNFNLIYHETANQYRVQPLYIVCQGHDGHFNEESGKSNSPEEACKKIVLGLKLVQCLYAEKLLEHDQSRKTFTLIENCHIFRSKLSAEAAKKLDENALWNEFARELLNSEFGEDEKLKFVAFIGCTEYEEIADGDYSYENIKRHTKAQANLGGGGLALFGSGYLYCWPSEFDDILPYFENSKRIDLKNFLDDSNYRRTYGGCYATTIGAVCHELGHIFDLGHTEEGIMGNGFDYVNLVFTSKHLTEDLPNRIIDSTNQKDRRLTAIKRPGKFLQKYHEQKTGDSTFFTRNCAIILSLHRWINPENSLYSETDTIELSEYPLSVSCTSSHLRLIEIRDKQSNLVVDYQELGVSSAAAGELRSVNLSNRLDPSRHSLFVITSNGSSKFFA